MKLTTSIKDKKWIVYKNGDEIVATLSGRIQGYDCIWYLRYLKDGKVAQDIYSPFSMLNAVERADSILRKELGDLTFEHGTDVERLISA